MVQVVFCDLTAPILAAQLDQFQTLSTVRCVRQIVGRAPRRGRANWNKRVVALIVVFEWFKACGCAWLIL